MDHYAIAGGADALITFNAADFPQQALTEEGVVRHDPDQFLRTLWQTSPESVAACVEQVRAEAERLSGQPQALRALLKRVGLPRLGKALDMNR